VRCGQESKYKFCLRTRKRLEGRCRGKWSVGNDNIVPCQATQKGVGEFLTLDKVEAGTSSQKRIPKELHGV